MRQSRSTKMVCWSGLVVSTALLIAGCGGPDVPSGSVAMVGDATIKQNEFDALYPTAASTLPKEQARVAVMQTLLQREWTRQEAVARRVTVTDAQIRKGLLQRRRSQFGTDKGGKDYKKFLASRRLTEQMLLDGVRQNLLLNRLIARAAGRGPKVTETRVASYYDQHRSQFTLPARHDLRVLLAKTEDLGVAARRELEHGVSWDKVAVAFSIDSSVKQNKGAAKGVTSLGVKAVDKVMRAAPVGQVTGPIKSQYGWFVFEVQKVHPPTTLNPAVASRRIKTRLRASGRQRKLDEFVTEFNNRYRSKTVCANDYKVAECANGPASNPVPQQQPARPSPTNPQG